LGGIALIGRNAGDGLWLLGEAWVIHTDGFIGAVPAPPLDNFLEKGIFWPSGKEVAVEVSCLRIKQDENGHRSRFW